MKREEAEVVAWVIRQPPARLCSLPEQLEMTAATSAVLLLLVVSAEASTRLDPGTSPSKSRHGVVPLRPCPAGQLRDHKGVCRRVLGSPRARGTLSYLPRPHRALMAWCP
ncbi:uncharacterized protein LOC134530095 [Bacillus rossius redtenbacheri]|uniref:uncharacterized protein LOC134530095 n=1 Tax=Bacillus rossius redtenbacheri TaxID=93214 RepID=UPI002FDC8D4B